MTEKNDSNRAMLDSLHAQMGEWIGELDHRAVLDGGLKWLMQDIDEWRVYVSQTIDGGA